MVKLKFHSVLKLCRGFDRKHLVINITLTTQVTRVSLEMSTAVFCVETRQVFKAEKPNIDGYHSHGYRTAEMA